MLCFWLPQAFRYDADMTKFATELAETRRFAALETVFQRHPGSTLPARLRILAAIPETADPAKYAHLLPAFAAASGGSGEDTSDSSDSEGEASKRALPPFYFYWDRGVGGAGGSRAELILPPVKKMRDSNEVEASVAAADDGLSFPVDAPEETKPRDDPLQVATWLLRRVREIDARSGQLHHALSLIRLGLARLPSAAPGTSLRAAVAKLEILRSEAAELHRLVYACGVSGEQTSLSLWETMPLQGRLELVLADCSPQTVVVCVQQRLVPMMRAIAEPVAEEMVPASTGFPIKAPDVFITKHELHCYELLQAWLEATSSRPGGLRLAVPLVVASRPSLDRDARPIRRLENIFHLALGCVYAAPDREQWVWELVDQVYSSLPARSSSRRSSTELDRLQVLADQMEAHLTAAELLAKYGPQFAVSPRWFRDCAATDCAKPAEAAVAAGQQPAQALEDGGVVPQGMAERMLYKLCLQAARATPPWTEQRWRELMVDLLQITEPGVSAQPEQPERKAGALSWVPLAFVHEAILQQLLVASQFGFASELIAPGSGVLDAARCEQLLLSAAREYFNSAQTSDSAAMGMCRKCLSMCQPQSPAALAERHLVRAVELLETQFGVHHLPLQVRLASPLEVLAWAFERDPAAFYSQHSADHGAQRGSTGPSSALLELAALLGAGRGGPLCEVRVLIAARAMDYAERPASTGMGSGAGEEPGPAECFSVAHAMCDALTHNTAAGEAGAWRICARLAQCEAFEDISARCELCAFALAHAPSAGDAELLLGLWQQLDVLLQMRRACRATSQLGGALGAKGWEDVPDHDCLRHQIGFEGRQALATAQVRRCVAELGRLQQGDQRNAGSGEVDVCHYFYSRRVALGSRYDGSLQPRLAGRRAGSQFCAEAGAAIQLLGVAGVDIPDADRTGDAEGAEPCTASVCAMQSQLLQTLLRRQLLSWPLSPARDHQCVDNAAETLLQLAAGAVTTDAPLALSWLLAAAALEGEKCRNLLPQLQVHLQRVADSRVGVDSAAGSVWRWQQMLWLTKLGCRLFALEAAATLPPRASAEVPGNRTVATSAYEMRTAEVVRLCSTSAAVEGGPDSSDQGWRSGAKHWWQQLSTCVEANAVERLLLTIIPNSGDAPEQLNKPRFLIDAPYRRERCLKLACTADAAVLKASWHLGARHGVDKWASMLRHAQWLFACEGDASAASEQERATAVAMALRQLDCDATLLSRPAAFARAICSELFDAVPGHALGRLGVLCTLLLDCATKASQGGRQEGGGGGVGVDIDVEHVKRHAAVLQKLARLRLGSQLDYKALTGHALGVIFLHVPAADHARLMCSEAMRETAMVGLMAVCDAHNAHAIAKATRQLQHISESMLFLGCCRRLLRRVEGDSASSVAAAYKRCSQFLSKMEPPELRQLAERVALWPLCDRDNGVIGMALRLQAVDDSLQSVLGQLGAGKSKRAAHHKPEAARLTHLRRFVAALGLMLESAEDARSQAAIAQYAKAWRATRAVPAAMLGLLEEMVVQGVALAGPYSVQAILDTVSISDADDHSVAAATAAGEWGCGELVGLTLSSLCKDLAARTLTQLQGVVGGDTTALLGAPTVTVPHKSLLAEAEVRLDALLRAAVAAASASCDAGAEGPNSLVPQLSLQLHHFCEAGETEGTLAADADGADGPRAVEAQEVVRRLLQRHSLLRGSQLRRLRAQTAHRLVYGAFGDAELAAAAAQACGATAGEPKTKWDNCFEGLLAMCDTNVSASTDLAGREGGQSAAERFAALAALLQVWVDDSDGSAMRASGIEQVSCLPEQAAEVLTSFAEFPTQEAVASRCAAHAVQQLLCPNAGASVAEAPSAAAELNGSAGLQLLWLRLLQRMAHLGLHSSLLAMRRRHSTHGLAVIGPCAYTRRNSCAWQPPPLAAPPYIQHSHIRTRAPLRVAPAWCARQMVRSTSSSESCSSTRSPRTGQRLPPLAGIWQVQYLQPSGSCFPLRL